MFGGSFTLLAVAAALLSFAAATSGAADIKRAFEKFSDNEDVDLLCDAIESHYGSKCRDEIEDDTITRFVKVIRSGNSEAITNFLGEHMFQHDQAFEMDRPQCADFHKDVSTASDNEVVDLVSDYVSDIGYQFQASKIRSKRTLGRRVQRIRNSHSCNLKHLGGHIGQVHKSLWSYVPKAPSTGQLDGSWLRVVSEFISESIPRASKPLDLVDADIASRRKQAASLAAADLRLSDLEKKCVLSDDAKDCRAFHRQADEIIMENLGVIGIRIVRHDDRTRDVLFAMAKLIRRYNRFKLADSLELFTEFIRVAYSNWLMFTLVVVLVTLGYSKEVRTLTSVCLASTGFAIIPAITLVRHVLAAFMDRASGIALAMAVLGLTVGLHTTYFSSAECLIGAYGIIVFYFNVFRPQKTENSWTPALSVLPLMVCAIYLNLDVGQWFANYKLADTVVEDGFITKAWRFVSGMEFINNDVPHGSAIVASILIIAIFMVCSHCDTIGLAAYRDVMNRASKSKPVEGPKPKPSIMDYLMSSFNTNAIIVLAGIAVPSILNLSSWVTVACIASSSMLLSAAVYHFMFHEEYVREGETTGSTRDRICESMNIIAGMAPKTVILPKFQNYVIGSLVIVAFCVALRVNYVAAVVVALFIATALYNRPTELQTFVGWFSALVIGYCGTTIHVMVSLAYLHWRVGHLLKFNLSSMRTGETLREVGLQ